MTRPPCAPSSRCVDRVVLRRRASLLGAAGRAKADDVVRPVAERPEPRLSAPTQGDGRLATAHGDLVAVLVHERERAADEQWAVTVGGDHGFRVRHSRSVLPRGAPAQPSLPPVAGSARADRGPPALRVAPAGSGRAVPARGPRCRRHAGGLEHPAGLVAAADLGVHDQEHTAPTRWSATSAQIRSRIARPSAPASVARAVPRAGGGGPGT